MSFRTLVLTVVLFGFTLTSGRTQTPSNPGSLPFILGRPAGATLNGPSPRGLPASGGNFLQEYFRLSAEGRFAGTLTVQSERLGGLERFEASRYDLAMEGIGAGATMGLLLGAAGSTTSVWSEETSWYVAGAAAALGAFLKAIQADDPAKRTRFRWSIDAKSTD